MRTINSQKISTAVEKLFVKINYDLSRDVEDAIKNALSSEKAGLSKSALKVIAENAKIARKEMIPICQDTGLAVIFVQLGSDVHIAGKTLEQTINAGVAAAVKKGYLRASVVKDPLERINTKNNTPAIIHTETVPGNKIKISVMAKGGGAENMSALKMLKPSDGEEGIIQFVVDTVKNAGPNPCPPIIVGVGIGGNFEACALLAKKSLLRTVGSLNINRKTAMLEKEILKKINNLKIGASGFGGNITCLQVNIETLPCHIASLPVAVNIECHAHRHGAIII